MKQIKFIGEETYIIRVEGLKKSIDMTHPANIMVDGIFNFKIFDYRYIFVLGNKANIYIDYRDLGYWTFAVSSIDENELPDSWNIKVVNEGLIVDLPDKDAELIVPLCSCGVNEVLNMGPCPIKNDNRNWFICGNCHKAWTAGSSGGNYLENSKKPTDSQKEIYEETYVFHL